MSVDVILLIVAAVCFVLAAFKVDATWRVSSGWAGLFAWVLTGLT